MKRKKIALINQRYGLEVNGGSEYHARVLAEHLAKEHDVEVLTTCARDYDTWENFYNEGLDEVNGIRVRRFSVEKSRSLQRFLWLDRIRKYSPVFTRRMEQKWIEEQGPYCPGFIQYISGHQEDYDVFIFVTYLYYLTAMGLKIVAPKSILIPTAHDEPFLKMELYKELFHLPRGYFFNTKEERDMVFRKFGTENIPCKIGGVGIEVPDQADGEGFKKRYQLEHYMIYVGRIDYGKNCHELFEYFQKYKEKNPGNLKLVLMGKEMIEVPEREDIISLGFVSEEEKYDGMAGADFLVLPSQYESMSIVVLDSLKLGIPVVVNGKCEVLKGHCEKSGGGIYYQNYYEFEKAVNFMVSCEKERKQMGLKGKSYVESNYRWDVILADLNSLIENCIKT